MSGVTCQVSGVRCQVSGIMCHLSKVTNANSLILPHYGLLDATAGCDLDPSYLGLRHYVSKQILLFVHGNSVVRPCQFCHVSIQILLCVYANESQRPKKQHCGIFQPFLNKLLNLRQISVLNFSLRNSFCNRLIGLL